MLNDAHSYCILGVGKTSIMMRFTTGDFDEGVKTTIGCDLKVKLITHRGGSKVKLTVWDTGKTNR